MGLTERDLKDLEGLVRNIPDFPVKGILFRDITPLLLDPKAFGKVLDAMIEPFEGERVDKIVGIEARGFIFAAPIALKLGAGFVPIRKPGKLPWKTVSVEYELEYGKNKIEVHEDAIKPGERVLLVDDLLATGGTMNAARELVEKLGGSVVGFTFFIELVDLGGRKRLEGYRVHSVLKL